MSTRESNSLELQRSLKPVRGLLRLFRCAQPYAGKIAIAFVSLAVAAFFNLVLPQILRLLIDSAIVQHDSKKLNHMMVLLVGALVGQALFGFLRSYLLLYTGERIVADLRTRLYDTLIRLGLSFFAERRVGELTSRLASDVTVLQSVATTNLGELLYQSTVLIGSIVIIATTNPKLTLVLLSVVPIIVVGALILYGGYLRRVSTSVQDALADAAGVLQETLSAVRIVQSFVREDYERRRYGSKINEALRLAARRSLVIGGFTSLVMLVVFAGVGFVIWYGCRMVIAGELSSGSLTAFVLYLFVVASTIGGLINLYGGFHQAIGSSSRVFELLSLEPEIREPKNAQPLHCVSGHVRLENISFSYSGERQTLVLRDINIEAQPGEIVALVGPSGAGKSTLISLLPRFYDAVSGSILIDSHDVRTVRLTDLRRAIGMVPQETVLFGGTIRDNIAYGKLEASRAEIEAAARGAHAHEFILEFPAGYETMVGERGVKLSGGQRQRIAIARAILKNPAILILDEATSSLDSESERLVQEAMEQLMQGRTTFVIAHRLATVRRAHKIVVLDQGTVVEQGTHHELLRHGGLYKQLSDLQFRDGIIPAAKQFASEI